MEFHTLSRKQLQALCKKNKIPANMTNVAMATALADLQQVEGIDEILNPADSEVQKCPDEKGVGSPDIHRTACRTSTRRKPVTEEPESSKISTRRGTRARNDEGLDQENKDLNVPVSPAVPTSRRRAPAVSSRKKKEDERPNDPVPKTPAASRSSVRATSAYNTRRSVRLLEKNLSKMSLVDTEETGSVKVDEISEEMTSVSQQIEDSIDTETGASSLTISTEVFEGTDESELTSSENNLSEMSIMDTDKTESVKADEISEEITSVPQQIEESEDTEKEASSQMISTEVLEKTDESELTSSESKTKFECKNTESDDSSSKGQSVSEVASDGGASLQADPQECQEKISQSEALFKDMNGSYESDVDLTKSICKEGDANDEPGTGNSCQIENPCDSSEPENIISPHSKNGVFSDDKQEENEHSNMGFDIRNSEHSSDVDSAEIHVSKGDVEDGASMVVAEIKIVENEHSNVGNDILNPEQNICSENNKEAVEFFVHCENECSNVTNDCIQSSEQSSCSEDKAVEITCDIKNSEEMFSVEDKVVETEDNSSPLLDELEAITSSDIEESKDYVEKDADMEFYGELSSEGNMNIHSLADSHSSLVKNEAEAESETTDIQFNNEELEENADQILSTMIRAPISKQKATEAPAQFASQDLSVLKDDAVEDQQNEHLKNDDVFNNNQEACSKLSSEGNMNVQSIADSHSSLVMNEAEAESETADAQIDDDGLDQNADQTLSTIPRAPIINEQKTTEVLIQFPSQDQSELKDDAVENQTVRKICDQEEEDKQKEDLKKDDDLNEKSIRKLKKMLKNFSLDCKTNKEVGRKRTALQVLPENGMTASNGQQ